MNQTDSNIITERCKDSEYMKNYYQRNKEKLIKNQHEYDMNHRDEKKEYYQRNKDKRSEYYELNKDRILKNQKARRAAKKLLQTV